MGARMGFGMLIGVQNGTQGGAGKRARRAQHRKGHPRNSGIDGPARACSAAWGGRLAARTGRVKRRDGHRLPEPTTE
ncbi:conserved hypothetical protein [Paraburkholderia caribensis]|nr:conserved hypothetical protein [Paraburkholderia caribensis]